MLQPLFYPKKPTTTDIENGRILFAQNCQFLLGCVNLEQIPNIGLIEVAFAGRSNVGKSSLINALVNQKAMARTSNAPGRTRQINFFNLGKRLIMVDLPGYGYARVSKLQVEQWTNLVKNYLRGRVDLRRTFILVDARHGLKKIDSRVLTLLDGAAQSYQLILTKCDKIKSAGLNSLEKTLHRTLANHPAAYPEICLTSSKTGDGIPHLRATLAALASREQVG